MVLLDVHMPGGGGVEVIRQVAEERPAQRFLALSVSDAAEDVIAVIRAGARGYVTKSISGEELAEAIERVRDGDAVFSPRLAGFVLDAFHGEIPEAEIDPELDQLTLREREVLRLIARGYLYKEIALRARASRRRRSRPTSAPCSASCSSRTATSWAAGRSSGAWSTEPRYLYAMRGARRTGKWHDVYFFEPGLFAPAGKVAAREIKRVAELDQHVERHHQPERVFTASVINDVLDCNESATLRQRVVGGLDQMHLVLEVPVVEDQPHGDHVRVG